MRTSTRSPIAVTPLDRRLDRTKFAYSTRRVPRNACATIVNGKIVPRSGDLLLASVVFVGHHRHLEVTDSRHAQLFPGDEICICYGNRYAPSYFEAEVPSTLGPCDLVAAGGVAARILSAHSGILRPPTALMPIGLIGDATGRPVNLLDWALPTRTAPVTRVPTVAVAGTQMDAGKTTTAANLVKGLVAGGLQVGAAKITGTAAGKDPWFMRDAGAKLVLDFTDAGFPSTYKASPKQVEGIMVTLIDHLLSAQVDAIVLEIADGLFQRETGHLVASTRFRDLVGGVVFAAHDSLGAAAGVTWLRRRGVPVFCVSGLLTASALVMREAAAATGVPAVDLEGLRDPSFARELMGACLGLSA